MIIHGISGDKCFDSHVSSPSPTKTYSPESTSSTEMKSGSDMCVGGSGRVVMVGDGGGDGGGGYSTLGLGGGCPSEIIAVLGGGTSRCRTIHRNLFLLLIIVYLT